MIAALLTLLTLGQLLPPDPPLRPRVSRADGAERVSRLGADDYAFFEAFPASGAGTFGVCSTTPPTGAKGEALTFARTSPATCTKTAAGGLATTGIANGDLVAMSSGQPRVEYDSAGTLGLLVESSRINSTLRSQQLDDLAWTLFGSGVAAPTVTADYATAPDGTLTAERLQVAATTLGSRSIIFQASVPVDIRSVYVKGANGTSGVIDVAQDSAGVANNACGCAYNPTTWTRCATRLAATGSFTIGNDGSVNACGSGTRAALDVLVWGAQSETGTYATSYIPTTSAAVTRVADSQGRFTNTVPPTAGSSAASVTFPSSSPPLWYGLTWGGSAEGPYGISDARCYDGTTQVINATTYVAGVSMREWCAWSGATLTAGSAGTSTTGAFDGTMGTGVSTLDVGAFPGPTNHIDGIISRICVDPSPGRCR